MHSTNSMWLKLLVLALSMIREGGGDDRMGLWYQYQLPCFQVSPKLKLFVPAILGNKTITDNEDSTVYTYFFIRNLNLGQY